MHARGQEFESPHLHHFEPRFFFGALAHFSNLSSERFFFGEKMLTLDLHRLRHEDAKRKLELFINDHWGKMLKIITGHSSLMRCVVSSTAESYNLDFVCEPLGTYIIIKSH